MWRMQLHQLIAIAVFIIVSTDARQNGNKTGSSIQCGKHSHAIECRPACGLLTCESFTGIPFDGSSSVLRISGNVACPPIPCEGPTCQCDDGFAFDAIGRCVPFAKCPQLNCSAEEHVAPCGNRCEQPCVPYETCASSCQPPSCHCNDGYRRRDDGKCVLPEHCPDDSDTDVGLMSFFW